MNIHKRTRLTELQRKELWEKYKNGIKVSTLAEVYLTSRVTIYKILARARVQEFRPRKSTNHKYRTLEWWLKRLWKIEKSIIRKQNIQAKRYNKKYPWEMLHVDTKRLPPIAWDTDKTPEYLFVWVDDYSREAYVAIHPDKSQYSSSLFLKQILDECPYTIEKVYSDNGTEYKGSAQHEFVKVCEENGITQWFTRVKRPQTNGKAERFIRTVMEMWHQKYQFTTRKERRISLKRFVNWYNTVKPHKGIDNMTPYEVIEQFYYPEKV